MAMTRLGTTPEIGIGSYCYRYAIGVDGFRPAAPMDLHSFMKEAVRLGLSRVQLCENLDYTSRNDSEFAELGRLAREAGIVIEVGMRDLSRDNFARHLELADRLSAPFLRVVLGKPSLYREPEPEALVETSVRVLADAVPAMRRMGILVGIENHFDLCPEDIARVVEQVNEPCVGLVFDTTNSLGFVRSPEETLRIMGPRLLSVHLKDYVIQKVEAGYLIRGVVLGEGWLNLDGILREAVEYNPSISIVLEMSIRREPDMDMAKTLEWERDAIERSLKALRSATRRLVQTQPKEAPTP